MKNRLYFIFIILGGIISCSSSSPPPPDPSQTNTLSQTYKASYDAAWSATLKALSKYQVTISNKDTGLIKTDFIISHAPKETKWKLELRLLASEAEETVKVRVEKEAYISPGFLEAWEPLQTDFWVEKALLYRIGRIIELDARVDKLTTPPATP
ncbi:MAG: hypothetical protein A2Z91_01745 [Deltaproteobacteria bacterium GWA2_38_16]|nr:MAG: hypothetical protein A2Z91_01745 [Deltaproteobacteria bacterium GWA2_38_16]OGQ03025.1 MAG: hypothetical protein A3D19_01265 [Deltaproteobacteria bacterium RIFCSPHIGHO2_02_FULL_38_15]OGQ33566.1 MAG: hypothetical protein A3A72_09510 [Deltaproteobacteria bacterium RIFCSPLOWO2_01_FULL_38_9]HBQ21872.1 hypothetical protein [Deltaproteobacteria bacterium]